MQFSSLEQLIGPGKVNVEKVRQELLKILPTLFPNMRMEVKDTQTLPLAGGRSNQASDMGQAN